MPDNDKPAIAVFRSDPKYQKDNQFLREWLEAELTERAAKAQQPRAAGAAPSVFDFLFGTKEEKKDDFLSFLGL